MDGDGVDREREVGMTDFKISVGILVIILCLCEFGFLVYMLGEDVALGIVFSLLAFWLVIHRILEFVRKIKIDAAFMNTYIYIKLPWGFIWFFLSFTVLNGLVFYIAYVYQIGNFFVKSKTEIQNISNGTKNIFLMVVHVFVCSLPTLTRVNKVLAVKGKEPISRVHSFTSNAHRAHRLINITGK
ncbi:predicted protein [Arabidopsis lyrata subsp. lyrata]|uniref:Predicted protein n=1 Tax=Arabidopsis lyrata subsp. lyrata TaxID=81972 RepID=D7LSD9_ARALL|nr:predicted protein [Arabidopsis lyrata subsp. lyrata]